MSTVDLKLQEKLLTGIKGDSMNKFYHKMWFLVNFSNTRLGPLVACWGISAATTVCSLRHFGIKWSYDTTSLVWAISYFMRSNEIIGQQGLPV